MKKQEPIIFNEYEVVEMLRAASKVCQLYFEIAEKAIGEKELRKQFNVALNKTIKAKQKKKPVGLTSAQRKDLTRQMKERWAKRKQRKKIQKCTCSI
jgi:hypothetical protein